MYLLYRLTQADDYVLPSKSSVNAVAFGSAAHDVFALGYEGYDDDEAEDEVELIPGTIDISNENGEIVGSLDAHRFRF